MNKSYFQIENNKLNQVSAIHIIITGLLVTRLLYQLFYYFSEQIWGFYLKIDPLSLTPSIRQWVNEHDGIEAYVLYVCSFLGMGFTAVISLKLLKLSPSTRINLLMAFIGLVSLIFFKSTIGFHPPMPAIAHHWQLTCAYAEVGFLLLILNRVEKLPQPWLYLVLAGILLPLCFVAMREISLVDYSFIFSPAYRLLNHSKIQNIYFQYDLLIPILAAAWMKLGFALNDFQLIPRISVYLYFFGMFIFAHRNFRKPLAYLLLTALIIIKLYAIPNGDLVTSIQLTPIRLDLWLILLIVATEKGIYSKILGIVLASMNVLTHSFGIFYSLSYIEVCIVIGILDYLDGKDPQLKLFYYLKKHVILIFSNLMLLGAGLIFYYLIFHRAASEAVVLYQRLGVGFLRVSPISFYWYILIFLFSTFALIIQQRHQLKLKYFHSALFLLFLVVANSLYFLGRSHEWNLINISGSCVLIPFLFLDILDRKSFANENKNLVHESKTWLIYLFSFIFITIITYYYSERIVVSVMTQLSNIYHGRLEFPITSQKIIPKNAKTKESLENEIFDLNNRISLITKGSKKVYVLSYLYDFYFDYYSKYKPRGYFFPYYSWIFIGDLKSYLQNLLDKGFYLAIPLGNTLNDSELLSSWEVAGHKEILEALDYTDVVETNGVRVIWRRSSLL